MATVPPSSPMDRPILRSLDPNWGLNDTSHPTKRRTPITFDQENEMAVVIGTVDGIYDLNEVIDLTNHSSSLAAALTESLGSDDEAFEASPHAGAQPLDNHPSSDLEELAYGGNDDEMVAEGMDEDLGVGVVEGEEDEEAATGDQVQAMSFDPAALGLKEINNLAHFGVSSHKPGNGVEELLSDDLDKYWQSDGQQPHLLTIHFLRRAEIRAIRFYVDYNQDESYTPTHVIFYAGTGHHDLTQFAELPLSNPVGWQDVPIAECGGGADGQSLCCWIVQVHVKENHQNGKDTHIRGIKIFALDEYAVHGGVRTAVHEGESQTDEAADPSIATHLGGERDDLQELLEALDRTENATRYKPGEGGFSTVPDFMRDPELR